MSKILQKSFLICCLITALCSTRVMAGGIESTKEHSKNGVIRTGDVVDTKDDKYRAAQEKSFNWEHQVSTVKNTITLRIIDTKKPIPKKFSCDVTLEIEYFSDPAQTVASKIDPEKITLHVDYSSDLGTHYKIADRFSFTGAYYVKVKVTGINSPEFGSTPSAVLELENLMVIDRTYKFMPDLSLGLRGNLQAKTKANKADVDVPTNQLQLSWTLTQGAEEYDLEWTTVDEGSKLKIDDSFFPEKLFKNNATRITTSGNGYLISLIYNTQYVVVRIRQVHYNQLGIREEGTWDYKKIENEVVKTAFWDVSNQAHESNLNWQYSASFAEEGKKKEVISYFDGTLRGRQTTTLNNSDSVAVVQENVYDEFGRPAASILPSPVKAGTAAKEYLHYFSKLNLNSAAVPYSFRDIINGCEITPGLLNTVSGASQYYSPKNQFLTLRNKKYDKYIPDADGYPLSLTQYTPDNTGRIRLQGGVGATFQPGDSPSKTTKYFYGKPEQWELDRLFGNDVGFASHYLKNVVIDPNGQVSVSYLNASGKTIATALTGNAPLTQDALATVNATKPETTILLRPEQFSFNATDLKLSASTTYLSTVRGKAVIKYDIEKLMACYTVGAFKACSNCYYDLTIQVKDDCGLVLYDNNVSPLKPFKVGSISKNENDLGTYSSSLDTLNLDKVGEYYVSFELSLSRKAITDYTDKFIADGQVDGAIKKELNFIMEYLDKMDLSGLGDCHTCSDMLGDKEAFTAMFAKKLTDLHVLTNLAQKDQDLLNSLINAKYLRLKEACDAQNCPPISPCQKCALLMEEDVRPGGQYALFTTDGQVLEPELNVLSKFWRVEFPVNNLDPITLEPRSIPESDLITISEDGTQTSPYASNFSLPDLIKYWNPEWASKFVKHHPESCKLTACLEVSNVSSLNWDKEVQETTDEISQTANISGATVAYNRNASNCELWLLNADPFFKLGAPGQIYHNDIQQDLEQYTSRVLKVTQLSTKTLPELLDYITYCAQPGWTTNSQRTIAWDNCTPEPVCRVPDREWQDYREKYFELKENYYKRYRDDYCKNEGLCAIGTPITIPLPGSISINDFRIDEEEAGTECPGQQRIRISFTRGIIGKATTIQIYYPGQSASVNVKFAATSSKQFICVPANLEINAVKVSNIIQ